MRVDTDFEMVLVPFELRPSMPLEGWRVSELEAAGHSDRVSEHLRRVAKKEGFPLVLPEFLPNTHKAHTLAELARDHGSEIHEAVHRSIFAAYFAEGLDIGDEEILLTVAEGAGVDSAAARLAWSEDRYDERLHQFRHVALHIGIDATPATLVCNELIIGSRPAAVIREALKRCGLHVHEEGEAVESERSDATLAQTPQTQRWPA